MKTSNSTFRILVAALTTALLVCDAAIAQDDTAKAPIERPPTKQGEADPRFLTGSEYNPLTVDDEKIETLELTVTDDNRSREIPLLVYLPKSTKPVPVIVHSHGLGGTKNTSPFLGKHWAARGYLAVFVQHPGSDDSVWKNIPRTQIKRAMTAAASGENLMLRTGDIHALLDQLEKWNVDESSPLKGRMDLKHIGMSGHSFGAVTTQHIGGIASFGTQRSVDRRVIAAIPMSPSSPRGGSPEKAFGKVSIPWLCMTGTKDISQIGGADLESRLAVYPALPKGDKYELVLFNAEHSVFTEERLRLGGSKRNPNHHIAIKAITTAFWDTYLREDSKAKNWISTDAVRSVLEKDDRWQTK